MSDEEKDEVTPDETTTEGTEEEGDDKALPPGTSSRMASVLSRPTDYVARPGFRNPSNAKSKAQKQKRKGKKKR